jgi:hypothetical protein
MKSDPQRIRDLFAQALAIQDMARREVFLDQACPGGLELRQEVEELLRADAHGGGFLNPIAAPLAGDVEIR